MSEEEFDPYAYRFDEDGNITYDPRNSTFDGPVTHHPHNWHIYGAPPRLEK